MNKFSIIIPSFNSIKTLPFTLGSIKSQNYKNYEVIIIDDCSSDNHDYDKFLSFIDDLTIIKNSQNKGPTFSKNIGIKKSKGNIICFLDSDDMWSPCYLSSIDNYYKKYDDIDSVFTYFYNGKKWLGDVNYKNVLDKGYLTSPSSISCKKHVFKKIQWREDFYHSEDDAFCFDLTKHFKVKCLKKELVFYGSSHQSMSKDKLGSGLGYIQLYNFYKNDIVKLCSLDKYLNHQGNSLFILARTGRYLKTMEFLYKYLLEILQQKEIKLKFYILSMKLLIALHIFTLIAIYKRRTNGRN